MWKITVFSLLNFHTVSPMSPKHSSTLPTSMPLCIVSVIYFNYSTLLQNAIVYVYSTGFYSWKPTMLGIVPHCNKTIIIKYCTSKNIVTDILYLQLGYNNNILQFALKINEILVNKTKDVEKKKIQGSCKQILSQVACSSMD